MTAWLDGSNSCLFEHKLTTAPVLLWCLGYNFGPVNFFRLELLCYPINGPFLLDVVAPFLEHPAARDPEVSEVAKLYDFTRNVVVKIVALNSFSRGFGRGHEMRNLRQKDSSNMSTDI